ncbi:MAG TPA: hypothetical protein VLH84_03520 [Patescibacteria group bacterium]|nr:hypothetical protein [Patescibacteria group bacterium]
MTVTKIATFPSKTEGPITVRHGHNERVRAAVYAGAFHPGIMATLGQKDQNRFSPEKFSGWHPKGGGRDVFTAWTDEVAPGLEEDLPMEGVDDVAGLVWIGGEAFPKGDYPDAPYRPQRTMAFRTAYNNPKVPGSSFEGQGIGRRLAIAGLKQIVELTMDGGVDGLPPLLDDGIWIETDTTNRAALDLYYNLGNRRGEPSVGFIDMGVHQPEPSAKDPNPLPRQGMVLMPDALQTIVANAGQFVDFV